MSRRAGLARARWLQGVDELGQRDDLDVGRQSVALEARIGDEQRDELEVGQRDALDVVSRGASR
ncbi:hypothetical protein FJY68_06380 [candidate division WOR-3 bacterium]|uniref:Uncharacterized protein n=1 Tax=candidate division WOR-3 bacterium TaxID=2052148 RepID=A0A937XI32_UNCW3|nr:hypothetical protein [candidate division WOR-3 bacterium]